MTENEDFRNALADLARSEGWGTGTWDHRRDEHPPMDLLEAYHSGDTSPGEAQLEALRDHLATCARCASLVVDRAAFPDLPAVPGEPSEDEMASAWGALQRRLRQEGLSAEDGGESAPPAPHRIRPVEARRGGAGSAPREPAAVHGGGAGFLRQRLGWLVAAALLVVCFGLGSWSINLDHRLEELALPHPNVPLVDLDDGRTRSGPAEAVEARLQGPFYLLIFYPALAVGDENRFSDFSWRIRDETGKVRLRGGDLELQPGLYFTLLLPRTALPPGAYRVEILGHEGGGPPEGVPVGEQKLRIPEAP